MIPKSEQKSSNWLPKLIQMATKKHLKSMLKISSQNEQTNLDLGVQNGLVFWRFWHPKSTSEGSWSPARSQNLKISKNVYLLIKNHKKQSEKQEIELSGIECSFNLFEGLADCAQRLSKK